uniref:Na(+)/H(+) exchange regulatory cofactor NHE-RF1 n=1 Tax=Anolis carolinensis TaxID=28377 RepID=A0A803SZH8_ANOCA
NAGGLFKNVANVVVWKNFQLHIGKSNCPNGYGFNLHSDKTKPGQYIRAVDPDSPAEATGLLPQDRIIEVNGVCMEGKQHADVVSAIRSGGDETKLLVVDVLTDEFFKKCKVIPSEAHLKGEVASVSDRDCPASKVLFSIPSKDGWEGSPIADPVLDLDIPLAVAKERAHQKRTSKRAPQMDWSKKNELFSNL